MDVHFVSNAYKNRSTLFTTSPSTWWTGIVVFFAVSALLRRYVSTRLAMPRPVIPVAPRIPAQNLHDSVSWLFLASNNEHFALLVPTCLFAVLLQDNDHRALFALPHESQPLCLLLHLSFQTLTTPTPSIAPREKQHRRSLRKARA
jgi:hypothetical protein